MLEEAKVLWEKKESYYDLQVMRETRGRAAFDKEKQNEPWAEGASVFASFSLRRFTIQEDRIIREPPPGGAWNLPADDSDRPQTGLDELRVFGFLDPALGGATGDFAAIATIGVDPVGYYYLLDVWLERVAPSQQIARAFDLHERWHYEGFGVETNAFQKLLLEPIEIERARRRARGKAWDMPLIERRHRTDKESRILSLEPKARAGWLLFNTELSETFMNQLREFPEARHDDGPDATAAALELAGAGRGAAVKSEKIPRRMRGAIKNY